ncbi:MAG: hypothetical protein HY652_11570 [Acidobacteria bacterium]|nr:hypothetical protein [Acidobacteriota bacterium]
MLVLTDENLFRILEYSRLDNTPSRAAMTEPRRIVGGTRTHAEMMCGVYIDPKTLDTYVINNDTQDWMPVFSKKAQGNVAPDRVLATPHRTFGIAVDEESQELFLTVQHPPVVVVYHKTAKGTDAPIRILEGGRTGLEDPHGIALDTKNDWMFVSNYGAVSDSKDGKNFSRSPILVQGNTVPSWVIPNEEERRRNMVAGSGRYAPPSITVYSLKASGDTPPLRVIEGPKTRLNWPAHLAVGEERGELFVANDADDGILVFRTSDHGDVPPSRVIRGSMTGMKNPIGVALDLKNGELWVANMGNHSATVYPITANGDVKPLRTIRGGPSDKPALMIGNPGAVGYDTKREEVLVPN